MSELMKSVLSLSLSGSLLILLLLLCGPLIRNRLSRRWQYYIWLVVVARLLLPLSPAAGPVGALFQDRTPDTGLHASAAPAEGGFSAVLLPGQATAPSASQPEEDQAASAPEAAGTAVWERLWPVWLVTALLLLVRKITAYQSFARYVRAGREEVSDPALLDRLARIGAWAGVRRPVELYVNRLAASPLLLGFFRPAIVLPTAELPEEDFAYTAAHELIHLRRRDVLYKWLVQAAVCIHWFNPLVWLMSGEIGRACELSCDEAVIRRLSPEERRAYGDTLVRAMEAGGGWRGSPASVALNQGGKQLKERLKAIMRYKKGSKLTTAASLLLAAALIAGAASAGAYCGPGDWPEPAREESAGILRYTQEGFCQPPYLFEIGWNVSGERAAGCARTELALPGGAMTVYYTAACADALRDADVRAALAALLSRLQREEAETGFLSPLVVSVRDIGDAAPAALAEQYYEDGDLPQFGAVFALLDEADQRAMLERIYGDGAVAFFSIAFSQLDRDCPLVETFAGRAYEDGSVGFFSVLANSHMGRTAQESWLARAAQDRRAGFQSVLLTALDRDGELGALKDELKKQLAEEYAAHGIVKKGTLYSYQGQLVNIFLDPQPGGAVYTLSTNPRGTVNIRVVRDGDGAIERVEYLPEEEAAALLADMSGGGDDEDEDWDDWDNWDDWDGGVELDSGAIPAEFARIKAGEVVWLGDFDLAHGDRIQYDVLAEAGGGMQVGFARPGDDSLHTTCFSVENHKTEDQEGLRCTASFLFTEDSPVEPGRYRLFLRSTGGDLTGVSGGIAVAPAGGSGGDLTSRSAQELPEAVREAIGRCASGQWYVLRHGGRQYVWYGGFAWSFGWQPGETEAGWRLDIVKFQRKDSGDLLLSLPEGALDIRVDGEAAVYTAVDCGG